MTSQISSAYKIFIVVCLLLLSLIMAVCYWNERLVYIFLDIAAADFRKDIPSPPQTTEEGHSLPTLGLVIIRTTLSPSDLQTFYEQELPKRGWTFLTYGSCMTITNSERIRSLYIRAKGKQTEIWIRDGAFHDCGY